jgi:hypothetical protein
MQPEENNQESVDPKSMYQDPGLTETRASAEEIVGGAKQEDQLDKFKQAVGAIITPTCNRAYNPMPTKPPKNGVKIIKLN